MEETGVSTFQMKNTKDFPKSRISAIDIFPYFKEGFQAALAFCRQHSISINDPDGVRVLYGYCLKFVKEGCKDTKCPYQTVLCLDPTKVPAKLKPFTETHFLKVTKFFPHPYCGSYSLKSPDLELAAEKVLQKTKKLENKQMVADKLKLKAA